MVETTAVDASTSAKSPLTTGLCCCWVALALLPLGLAAIGGGPCPGPRDVHGSAILLAIGLAAVFPAGYGIARVVGNLRAASNPMRIFAVLSICVAGLVVFVGALYAWIGISSLRSFLH